MVGEIIRDYIHGGKAGDRGVRKLTVPGFGTFMRKSEGEVIFVDLLRGDDGLLRQMVEDRGHYSEVEAMVVVDRFIFEVKNELERTGSAILDGFGTLTLNEFGVYDFDHSPKARFDDKVVVQSQLFAPPAVPREFDSEVFEDLYELDTAVCPPVAKVVGSFDELEDEDKEEDGDNDEPLERESRIRVVQRVRPVKTDKSGKGDKCGFGFLVTMVVLFLLAAVGYGVWVWIFNR